MATYKEELLKVCNIKKGFYELLTDSSMHLDFINYQHSTDSMSEYYKKSFKFDCPDIQAKYFFKHLNAYFNIVENLSIEEKEKQIIASMLAFNNIPLNNLCNYLDSIVGTTKLTNVISYLKDYNFASFVVSQKTKILNSENFSFDISIGNKTEDSLASSFAQIENIIKGNVDNNKKYIYSTLDLNSILNKLAVYYEDKNKNNEDYKTITNSQTISNVAKNDKEPNYFDKLTDKIKIPESLEKRFKTLEGYFNEMHSKYQTILDSLEYDSQNCRYIRTLIYTIAYITRNNSNVGSIHMRNITNVDVGWAVGDENNKNASFYGNSEIAKAFSAYYAFMNVKENPYTELINNSYVSEMDYNAMMLHGYVANNGFLKLLFEGGELIKEVHKTLKTVREIITLLDTPITFGGDLLGWLKGLVASLTNAAATIIDLSLGELAKALFFVPVIPIGDKKYSVSDIYNYVNFIRLICENAENLEIGTIDRDQFVQDAYNYLGIDNASASKIGYFAYDLELNSKIFPIANADRMFQNQYGSIFTAKQDLKLFYSLLQFAIQKHIYMTDDVQFETNFNYSSTHLISNMIQSLNTLEVFYIFNIYGVNFYTLKNKLKDINNEKMLTFNSNLYNTTVNYDHHSTSFYEEYDKMDKSILYEKMLGHDFSHSGYGNLINLMNNYYSKVVQYNKKQLDSAVFAANDISDIDDFFMRFIPSIIELGKTLGFEIKTFKQIADLLNSFCSLITDFLFKNLYLNLRVNLTEIIKTYTDDMFEKLNAKLDSLDFLKGDKFTLDLELGNNRFVKILDKIIYSLENGKSIDLEIIEKCFKDFGYGNFGNNGLNFGDGTIGDPNTDYDIGTSYPKDPDYEGIFGKPDKWEDDLNLRYEGEDFSNNKYIQEDFNKKHEEYNNPNYEYDNNSKGDKIIYEQGNIIIENPNGNRVTILTPEDNHHSFTEDTSKRLPKDEFDKLVHIRDFIENVKDKELVHIQNLIKNEENRLEEELNKRLPNYSIIQSINKNIQDLTEELESVKNKNRTIYSESIVLKYFDSNNSNNNGVSDEDYSYLNEFFNKEDILDEVEEIVIKNDSPLTNYQITELLK